MKRLAIIGAGGHGKVVAEIAELLGWNKIVFFDDDFSNLKPNFPWFVAGETASLKANFSDFDAIVVAIGDNKVRAKIFESLSKVGADLPSLIHPAAVVSERASVNRGSVVMANAVINSSVRIGEGVIINTASLIEHDCEINDFVHISPMVALAGGVSVGEYSWVGIGASIIHDVRIKKESIVAAGATVIHDVEPYTRVAGTPAKPF